ncbi:MAG: BppU family phage baseplate upper protein [Clostridia bacterium]|nr:BppU family phage baseplate upper protein [Clostridia bacterium]
MVTNEIKFEVWKDNYIIVYTRKGEINARSIVASFQTNDGNNLDLSNKTVTFYALKPDKTQIFNNCTINTVNGTASISLTSQMVSVSGIVDCEYQIFEGNDLLLKVGGLKLVVENTCDFSEAIESTSECNALINAINEAEEFSESLGALTDLTTTDKTTIIGAINEINGKTIPISEGGTGATTATAARTNLGVMTETQLYYNSAGTTATITLSDSIANYNAVEIFYMEDDYSGPWQDSLKIYNNGSSSAKAVISSMYARLYESKNQIKIFAADIIIAGSSLTWGDAKMATFASGGAQNVADLTQYGSHKIYKVVGYKY